jgi:hypothetical protein
MLQLPAADRAQRLVAAHHPAGAVAGGTERATAFGTGQHVGEGAHRAGDQHRLAGGAQVGWQVRVAGWQRPGGALALHAQQHRFPVHLVGFHLRQIVGDVVDKVQPGASRLGENLPGGMREHVPVGAAVVGRGRHRAQVATSLRGADRDAGELAVGHGYPVPGHGPLHDAHVVAADLVAETPGAAVNHDTDLALGQAEPLRRGGIVDLLDCLHLEEVVARAQAAHLAQPPVHRPRADLPGIGLGDSAPVLTACQVTLAAITLVERVAGATGQHVPHVPGAGQLPDAAGARPSRDSGSQPVHEGAEDGHDLAAAQIGGEEADAAGDVEADPAGRDHSTGRRVGGRDPADREAVSQVRSGIAYEAVTMPGNVATLATCRRE